MVPAGAGGRACEGGGGGEEEEEEEEEGWICFTCISFNHSAGIPGMPKPLAMALEI